MASTTFWRVKSGPASLSPVTNWSALIQPAIAFSFCSNPPFFIHFWKSLRPWGFCFTSNGVKNVKAYDPWKNGAFSEMNFWLYAFGRYWLAFSPCFFISLASVRVPLLSMHVVTRSTPLSFICETSLLRSVTPKARLVSMNSIFADGYLSNVACTPFAQSADCGTWEASTPSFFLCNFCANHGSVCDAHVKHRYEPFSPKRFGGPGACSDPHSALMFQPKVGIPDCPSRSAPVNSSVATGSTANTLSSEIRPWTSWRFMPTWSSRLDVRFSLRP